MTTTGEDCTFFYGSGCRKGKDCQFRHVEAAKHRPNPCRHWISGNCSRDNCQFRHPKKTPRSTSITKVKKEWRVTEEETTINDQLKPETKGDKDELGSYSTPQKSGQQKKELESDQEAVGGSDQDTKLQVLLENLQLTEKLQGNHPKQKTKDEKDEPGSDSSPKKSGQLKKELESDQGAVGGPDQDITAKGTTPLPKGKAKMDSFVEESMQNKTIRDVPGIGDFSKLAKNLEDDKYSMAEHLLAYFLSKDIQRAQGLFKQFIKKYGGDEGCQNNAYNALVEWTKKHL